MISDNESVYYKTDIFDTHKSGKDLFKVFSLLKKLGLKSLPKDHMIFTVPVSGYYQICSNFSYKVVRLNVGDVVDSHTAMSIYKL